MKFKLLLEDIDQPVPYDQLEEDLKEEERIKTEAVQYATEQLGEEEFEEIDELNGVSFAKSYRQNEIMYHCQFYLDTEAEKYSSYVTSEEDGDKQTSFQQKGSIQEATQAIDKFLKFVRTL